MATQAGAGEGWGGENRGSLPGQPAPDTLAETRVARLRSFRQPRVEELEEAAFLEGYLRWRNAGVEANT